MDITWILPVPEPVAAGGRAYLATCLRLRDVARLQGWLKARHPCPLEAVRPGIAAAEGETRRALLASTYEACEGWPPRFGTAEAADLTATAEGIAYFLLVLLGPYDPDFGPAEAVELADRLTTVEYACLMAVAFAGHPLDELARLIDPEAVRDAGREINWGAVACDLIEATGWTFDQIGDLHLSQFIAWRTRGKPGWGELPIPKGRTVREEAARRRRLFHGAVATST